MYVDNADFFNYEDEGSPDFVKLIPNSTLQLVYYQQQFLMVR